jgi:hypothetical protein
MKFEAKNIKLKPEESWFDAKIYPDSGFFIINQDNQGPEVQNGLVFVNKEINSSFFIATEEEYIPFNLKETHESEKKDKPEEPGIQKGFVSEGFALKLVELIVNKNCSHE